MRYAPLCRNCYRRPAKVKVAPGVWLVGKGHDLCRQCDRSLRDSYRAYLLRQWLLWWRG